MPDAKSLLPGRAFRSEHAQLRPEPHSIASHGPDPMDPLQTTRMRNGVLYAAEWPCCHDPLRLSLGSEDPFQHTHTRGAAPRASPLSRGGECDGCGAARASPACGEARRTRTLARGLGVAANKHKQTLKHLAPARRSFGQRPRRAACASRAWEARGGCADDQMTICTGVVVSRWRARGGSRLLSLPAPCSTKGWRAGPTGPPHTRTHQCRTTPHPSPPPPELPMPNQEHCVPFSLCPWEEPRLHTLTPAHSPSPLSTPTGLHIAPM